jgi:hypothetical protein
MILKRTNLSIAGLRYLALCLLVGTFSSCTKEPRVVELFDKGELVATASNTSILAGETVTFEETSTKVQSVLWTFDGGSPESSTSSNITVTYETGGSYQAVLAVTFVDNTIQERVFPIEVEGAVVEPVGQAPYGGSALGLPGVLQVENYDLGGEGVAYHDTEEENLGETAGSPTYREDDGVDLQVNDDATVVNIGYVAPDEWTEYTVNVQEAAAYDFEFFVASDPGGTAVKIQSVDGEMVTDLGELAAFPTTGGWTTYVPIVVSGINLNAGQQILRLAFTGGNVNVDKISITAPGVTVTEKFGIYSEAPVTSGTMVATEINNAFLISEITSEVFEGSKALEFKFDAQDTWGVMGAIRPSDGAGGYTETDISEYATGFYNIALKTTCTLKMNLRLQGGGTNGFVTLDDAVKTYGFQRDGTWQTLKIPVSAFVADGGATPDYAAISHLLVMRSAEAAVLATEEWDWYVDDVFLSKE